MSKFKHGFEIGHVVELRLDTGSWGGQVPGQVSTIVGFSPTGGLRFADDHRTYLATQYELYTGGSPVVEDANKKPGAKADAGKVRAGLVFEGFSLALMEVARIGTFGANKYSDNGWRSVADAKKRYTDAMYRHLMAEASGELNDPESEMSHAAHAAWNALARLHFILEERRNASDQG